VSRDEARALARQFAVQLRHLREFRGQAYVGAAPLPRSSGPPAGGTSTWPQGQVDTHPVTRDVVGEPSQPRNDTTLAGRQPDPASTWPQGQVEAPPVSHSQPAQAPQRSAQLASPTSSTDHGATRDPAAPPRWEIAPTDPARETWSSGQVPRSSARAERTPPATLDASPAAERLPVRLPTLPAEDPPAADGAVRDKARTWTAGEKLDYLRRKNIGNCQRCKLAATRTQIVFGVGDPEAEVMFIGEAPGFDEDRQGEPFVGAAGRRLTQWLGRLGLDREQVYIANVLKCRPPGNRDPEADEVERCSPFLRAQIRAIAPKVIVALGRHAGMLLLGGQQERTLREMRGRSWDYKDTTGAHQAALFVTYHPSYVIRRERELSPGQRNPADDTVMADLQQALQSIKQA